MQRTKEWGNVKQRETETDRFAHLWGLAMCNTNERNKHSVGSDITELAWHHVGWAGIWWSSSMLTKLWLIAWLDGKYDFGLKHIYDLCTVKIYHCTYSFVKVREVFFLYQALSKNIRPTNTGMHGCVESMGKFLCTVSHWSESLLCKNVPPPKKNT